MLRRLLGGLVALLLAFAVSLSLPLAGIVADRATQSVYLDRLADADRFATLADRGLRDGRTAAVAAELRQYFAVYDIRAWSIGVDGSTIVSADGVDPPPGVLADSAVDLAERGVQPDPPPPVSPTGSGDLLVAVPIGAGAEAIGVIVTLSPLDDLRRQIGWRWGALVAIAALITLILVSAAVPFTRWLLQPVARLDSAAGEIAAGRLESRVGLAAGVAQPGCKPRTARPGRCLGFACLGYFQLGHRVSVRTGFAAGTRRNRGERKPNLKVRLLIFSG